METEFLGEGDDLIEVERYQAECVRIFADSPVQLNQEFMRQPSDLAYWNARLAKAMETHLFARAEARRARARNMFVIRELMKNDGKKYTVDDLKVAVEAKVEEHEEVIATEHAMLKAEVERERVKGVIDAIRAKKDMLQQLGPNWRAEMQNDPTTAAHAAMHRAGQGIHR